MANFRMVPGIYVIVKSDIEETEETQFIPKDHIMQILHVNHSISFAGVNGMFSFDQVENKLEIYKYPRKL